MSERVYPPVIFAAKTMFKVLGLKFRIEGYENIPEGLAKGNGVILALPHLGGWEWAGRWLAEKLALRSDVGLIWTLNKGK